MFRLRLGRGARTSDHPEEGEGEGQGKGERKNKEKGKGEGKVGLLAAKFTDLSGRVAEYPPFSLLRPAIVKGMSTTIYTSGLRMTPQEFASQFIGLILLAPAVFAALALAGWLLALPPLIMAGALVSALPAALHALRPTLAVRRRKALCERELPFAATYLAMAAASSKSLSGAMLNMSRLRFLKAFRNEAERMDKVRRLYALSPSDAMIFEAKYHPSEAVKELLLSAAAAERSGESLFLMMKDELVKAFSHLLSRLKVMSDKFSMMASAQMIIFIIVPMATITISIMFSGIVGIPTLVFTCIILPCLFVPLMSLAVDSYFPKELTEPISLKYFLISLLAFPLAAALLNLQQSGALILPVRFEYVLALAIAAFAAPAAAWYARERRRTRQIISALPSFSRSVAEEVKKGNSPTQAVALISENRIFNPSFNNILRKMAAHVKMGRSIGETAAYVKMPWIARVYFELLDQAEQMGADPKSMDALSDLMNNIHTSMRSLDSETSLFKFSCYINSVILPFSIIIIVDVVVRLFMQVASSVTAISLPAGLSFLRVEDLPLLSLVAYSSVVLDAYLLGLLGGKISDGGSIVDGLKSALICVGIAVATLIVLRDLGIVTSLFGFR
jgi:archaellum biogenesis protein FlaJ (TadC family)